MTEITPERLAQIKARADNATAGPWETDATKNDGNYGGGPDCGNGFSSYEVMAASCRICDTLNSDVALVCEEYDEDGRTAFDEVGQANMDFIAAARQDIPDLIAALEAAQAENAKLRAILWEAAKASIIVANITETNVSEEVWKQITDATTSALESNP